MGMAMPNEPLKEEERHGEPRGGRGDPDDDRAGERCGLASAYFFRRPDEVWRFLGSNPPLSPLLAEAYAKIEEHFGSRPEVVLEVVRDPEARGLVQMFAYIVTALTPEDASNRLQRFDREWFLREVSRAKGLLNFDLEFR